MEFQREESSVESFEEGEDDVFYDELRRQILQLTAEEEEAGEDDVVFEAKKSEARKEGPKTRPVCYYGWPLKKEDCGSTPAWISSLWKTGNGTGVFIPQGVQTRRRNRSRRKSEKGRTYRRVEVMN